MKDERIRNGDAVVARKKPVEIEAFHMTADRFDSNVDWPSWMHEAWGTTLFRREDGGIGVHTLEGDHKISVNDWVIRGVKGELYPCKPDIFEATYDVVGPQYWPEMQIR